ncbi:acyltransferase [Paenibacillus lemnae]|uniref:Acyltransferase n=1 Tax=Paenibacillus lemnae TaxID=1330551 RepID=A0A848M7U8_PAELE|nr:acyltransferase [Paenibacillus lemnae]NMO96281.1 acyltransferase [Paenibacillus lemnae]
MRKERLPEIEYFRGLAFLAVVFQHSIAHYSVEEGMNNADGIGMAFLLMTVKFAVPAFVFITGLLLFYNDKGTLKYGQFVKKRIQDIYIPFAVWTLIHALYIHHINVFSLADLKQLGLMLITGKASSHLWYIVMLFQLYLLYPLIRRGMRFAIRKWNVTVKQILLFAAGIAFLLMTWKITWIGNWIGGLQIPIWSVMFTDYADRNALYFSFYFILGAAAGSNLHLWREKLRAWRMLYWPLFFFLFGFHLMHGIQEVIRNADGITFYSLSLLRPWMALFLIVSILVMYDISLWIHRKGSKQAHNILISIGKYSFVAYLMHILTLRISYAADEAWLSAAPSWTRILSSWMISVVLSYGAARLISRWSFGKWLGGVPNRQRQKTRINSTNNKNFNI